MFSLFVGSARRPLFYDQHIVEAIASHLLSRPPSVPIKLFVPPWHSPTIALACDIYVLSGSTARNGDVNSGLSRQWLPIWLPKGI